MQHSATHWCDGSVYYVEQRRTVLLHGRDKFQGTNGEAVESHILLFFDASERRYVADVCVLGQFQVLHNSPSSYHSVVQMVYTETLQILCSEVFQQFLACRKVGKYPVFHFIHTQACTEMAFKVRLSGTVVQHFLWRKVANELFNIVERALTSEKFACRNVEKAHTTRTFAEVNGSQEVVFLVVQHVVAHSNTRRNKFRYASSHHFVFGRQAPFALQSFALLLRVFELVAYCYAFSSTNKLWQEGIECVMRKSSHLVARCCTVVSACQRYAEYLRSFYGIVAIRFVEVATPKEH